MSDDLHSDEEEDKFLDSDESEDEEKEKLLKLKVNTLKNQIAGNKYFYDGYLELISAYQSLGELDELREVREKMTVVYPLTAEIWMDWVKDEQSICTTDEEKEKIISLFKRAINDYMSVKLWVEYLMFVIGLDNIDLANEVCEEALTAVGTHVSEGILVWQAVLIVQQQVFVNLQAKQEEEKVLEKQSEHIKSLYRRQARIPLLNMDEETFIKEATPWFGDSVSDLLADFQESLKKLEVKIPFEHVILAADTEEEKLKAYKLYIKHAQDKGKVTEVQNLYERAVADHCLNSELWEEYVRYVLKKFPSIDSIVLSVCERSQRNCPWSGKLCELFLFALEKFKDILGVENVVQKATDVLQRSLSCGGQSAKDVVLMWMSYLVMLRHQITFNGIEHNKELEDFRSEGQNAMKFIEQNFGPEGDKECKIPRFLARVEAEHAKNLEHFRDIWNNTILYRNDNFKNCDMWLEFISTERSYGSDKHCRKLFRRALEKVWDSVETIAAEFLRFEQESGTFETMEDFQQRFIDRMYIVRKRREEQKELEMVKSPKQKKIGKFQKYEEGRSNVDKDTYSSRKDFKRPREPEVEKKYKFLKSDEKMKVSLREKPEASSFIGPSIPSSSKKHSLQERDEDFDQRDKTLKTAIDHGDIVKHDPSKDSHTVFLSNLDYSSTEEDILPVFSKCGDIESLRLVKDFKGRSKGYAYLVFESQESICKALKLDRSKVNGRPMFISKCNPQDKGASFKYAQSVEKEKLFVRNLPKNMTENEVKDEFLKHGSFKDFRLVTYRNGFSKGICYITYHDGETAEKVRQALDGTEVRGNMISVQISDPSKAKAGSNAPVHRGSAVFGESSRASSGARQKLSLIPRSLQKPQDKMNGSSDADAEASKGMSNEDFRSMFQKK